ncbi:leucine-rich repeat domain-containing protein [Jejuia pallidilutea]|nr:leucine-rich repeat domain-containing protein [Jejuia pallidilutea]
MEHKILVFFIGVFFTTSTIWGQTTAIPDAAFENYLETHDANGNIVEVGDDNSLGDGIEANGLVFTDRINAALILSIDNLNINTLTGIEGFNNLETLICNNNNLLTLDVSSNLNLKSLLCGSNQLSDLDVSTNSNLEDLDCSSNQITALDVTNNTLLKSLNCSNNRITNIDVSQNIDVTSLSISNNRIDALLVNNNPDLESLFCASNQILALDLASNTNLKILDASNNSIINLDLSTINTVACPDPQTDPVTLCQGPSSINVSNNQLTSLYISNGFNDW